METAASKTMQQTILLVDDEVDVLRWIGSLLDSWGYGVLTSSDGFEALQLARATKPDLILMDVQMDPMSGPEVCEKLKQDYVTRSIPVILLTVHDQLRRKVEGLTRGADDYVVKTVDPLELKTRIETVVRRTEEQSNANPLTKLPGNVAIDREVARRLDSQERFSVCYCDIDNFKAYNDRYGYAAGDQIILHTASITVDAVAGFDRANDFVGHIGGDDFVFLTIPVFQENICKEIIARFDESIPSYYDEEDRERGYIEIENRAGKLETFPLMTITIAAVNNVRKQFESPHEISERAAEIKKYLKQFDGSNYLSDRRGTVKKDWRRRIEAQRQAYEARRRKAEPADVIDR
jgi:diguanylate cyclase (GGDEF)-like protein